MINISPDDLQSAMRHVDQAIYSHQQWHKDLIRTLVCHLPYDARDTHDDAHRHCRFGQWYYSDASEPFHHHDGFIAMEAEHEPGRADKRSVIRRMSGA